MHTSDQQPITVTYKSGRHRTQGWDTMQVIYSQSGRTVRHFVIARDSAGTIVRRTDIVLDRWEIINDADELQEYQQCFDERDRLALERTTP